MNRTASYLPLFLFTLFLLNFTHCDLIDFDDLIEEDPTKSRMEGVWEVTEAYNEDGESILEDISFPITLFDLTNDNSVISTAGPLITYIVYGSNRYAGVASKIDQVFNYAELSTNGGEWAIEGGVVDRFTIEMKLQGLPGQHTLTELLGWFGIGADYFDEIIYHKFIDVKVTFDDWNDSVMTWELDNLTEARYNIKDKKTLEYISWGGLSTDSFEKCTFVLTKRVKDLEDLVKDAVEAE